MKKDKMLYRVISCVHRLDKSYLPVLAVTNMIAAATPFVAILFSSRVLDGLVKREAADSLMKSVLFFVILSAVLELTRWALEKVKTIKENKISKYIELRVFDKAFSMDYEVLEGQEALNKIYKAREGINARGSLPGFCNMLGRQITLISKVVYAVIILSGLITNAKGVGNGALYHFMSKWYSILPVFLVLACAIYMSIRMEKKAGDLEKKNFEKNVAANRSFSYFFQLVLNYKMGKDIRVYHMADMIEKRMVEVNQKFDDARLWLAKKRMHLMVPSRIANMLFQILCNCYVGIKAILGLVSIGNVVKYVSSLLELGNSIGDIMNVYVQLQVYSNFLIYYVEFLEIENKKYEGTLPIEKRDDNEYELEFRDVSFRYPNSNEDALNKVNLKMKIGGKMAVVGPNGAGKTTFIKLLCRLYDPTEGEILLNGINIKYYDYDEYMRLFSVVFQDFRLFSFSLAENVAASKEYEPERVKDCLVMAGFGERLAGMEEGIETNIYQLQDKGVEISGGEAQKVAIARALYKDSPVVILDEPTSALDPVSEFDIYSRFNELVKEKTAIYISHRMSSCRFCDTILVFENGRIVQRGSHDELDADKEGMYHKMWSAQAQYYQKEAVVN